MGLVDEKLKEVVGDRYVSGQPERLLKYFRKKVSAAKLGVAFPETHQEIQGILRLAFDTNTPVFTLCDQYLPGEVSSGSGIIIDFEKMNKIERLDKRNLIAHVQRGITFAQLQKELKDENLRVATPAAATSESVVANFFNRSVIKAAAKYPDYQLTNMYVVLADGRFQKTGTHGISEEGSDAAIDGAAILSNWYLGSNDILGIVTRASVTLYPVWEKRGILVFEFDDLDGVIRALRDNPRREIGIEYLALDARYLKSLVDVKGEKIPPWTVVVGLDGYEEHVNWQERMIRQFIQEVGGRENQTLAEPLFTKIDEPWMIRAENHTEFFTLFNRVSEFDRSISWALKKKNYPGQELGRLLVAMDRGRAAYCVYELSQDGGKTDQLKFEINQMLLEQGAFFDRPQGDFAQSVFGQMEGYTEQLRRVKNMMDPKGILNPGILRF